MQTAIAGFDDDSSNKLPAATTTTTITNTTTTAIRNEKGEYVDTTNTTPQSAMIVSSASGSGNGKGIDRCDVLPGGGTAMHQHLLTTATNSNTTKYANSPMTTAITSAEYLGSNVEQMGVTPSPSPHCSPAKRTTTSTTNTTNTTTTTNNSNDPTKMQQQQQQQQQMSSINNSNNKPIATTTITTTTTATITGSTITDVTSIMDLNASMLSVSDVTAAAAAVEKTSAIALNSNSNSSTSTSSSISNSNSNSTTPSVIATPTLPRNGNSNKTTSTLDGSQQQQQQQQQQEPQFTTIAPNTRRSAERNELLATKALPLRLPKQSSKQLPYEEQQQQQQQPSQQSENFNITANDMNEPLTPCSWPPSPITPITVSSTSASSHSSTSGSSSITNGSAAKPLLSPSKKLHAMQQAQLLELKDMPQYLQFNPYVLKGYRPLQTFKGCLLSLFYWHNETINILTHAIPIIYILAIVPGLMPWEKEYRFLSFCHVFGSVAPWCGSFIYHLFMNIEKGENVYYRLLKLDMVGIWVSQSFGALPLVIATTFCFSNKWKWFIIISYCLFSLWGLYKALTASSPWQRRLCFALPFTMRSILTFLRTLGLVGGNRVALSHVYLQDGVSVLGGAIGAMRIPEKWFPGLVDFYLNSHNIMHVLVVVAVYSMHKATVKDFEWMSQTTCDGTLNTTASDAMHTHFGGTGSIEL